MIKLCHSHRIHNFSIGTPPMTRETKTGRQPWIDFCRGLAMIAVIIDHTKDFYPQSIYLHTIFSVTMFTFLGGICSAMSLERRTNSLLSYSLNRIMPILSGYAIATAAYCFYHDNFVFPFHNYFVSLLRFNASPHFYYLVFYLQLIAISPFLYYCIVRCDNVLKQSALILAVYILSVVFKKHTFILDAIGGGKILLGGSYFTVFALGMIFYGHSKWLTSKPKYLSIILATSIVALTFYEYFGCIYNTWSNPPNLLLTFYTLIITLIFFSLFNSTAGTKLNLNKLTMCIQAVGRRSLNIYLYNLLIILIARKHILSQNLDPMTALFKGIIFIPLVTLIPIGFYQIARFFRNSWPMLKSRAARTELYPDA